MSQAARVLVVEDDGALRASVSYVLRAAGYQVVDVSSGEDALAEGLVDAVDVALVDIGLPGTINGLVLARRLAASDGAVVFMTAAGSLEERLAGFDAGADEYIVKPFEMPELLARVKAVLRRTGNPTNRRATSPLILGELSVDPARAVARVGTEVLDLTPTERELLTALAQARGSVLSRTALLDAIDRVGFSGHVLERHVSSLRAKLVAAGFRGLTTVRGIGYRLEGS